MARESRSRAALVLEFLGAGGWLAFTRLAPRVAAHRDVLAVLQLVDFESWPDLRRSRMRVRGHRESLGQVRSAQPTRARTSARSAVFDGRSLGGLPSAAYMRIALDCDNMSARPSRKRSTSVGTFPRGFRERCSGVRCSLRLRSSFLTMYGISASSSATETRRQLPVLAP